MSNTSPGPTPDQGIQDGAMDSVRPTSPTSDMSCPLCDQKFVSRWWYENHLKKPTVKCLQKRTQRQRQPPATHRKVVACPPPDQLELHRQLAACKLRCHLPDHIPTNVRTGVAGELVKVLLKIITDNSVESWSKLMKFWYATIGQPKTSLKTKEPLSTVIRQNITDHRTAEQNCAADIPERQKSSSSNLAKKVNRKLQDGSVSGAVRILAEEENISAATAEVLETLSEKHPPNRPVEEVLLEVVKETFPPLTPEDMAEVVKTFPSGSAGGLDGMRPCYLKELLVARGQTDGALLKALCSVVSMMLEGKVPAAILPVLYGANLFPLAKKDGGIRPIAVGCTLRRIASKIVSKRSLHLCSFLQPVQLGFAVKNGCEAAVHVTRHFVETRLDSAQVHALVKVDVKNAFNCLDRNAILRSALQHLPLYQPYIVQCYGAPSFLPCEENVLLSQSGIQQGDPLGPLLYCLATRDPHRNLRSELKVSYLDDDVISGPFQTVLDDFVRLEEKLRALDLCVNVKKCEVFLFGGTEAEKTEAYRRFLEKFPHLPEVSAAKLRYLGAPLLDDCFVGEFKKVSEKVLTLVKRTSVLPVHQAYFLVRCCLGPVKLIYLLRAARGFRFSEALHEFDESLRISLSTVFNTRLAENAWFQITLPVPFGGAGIRLTEGLALPAFLASAHSVDRLAQSIIPFELECYLDGALAKWTAYSNSPPPVVEELGVQKSWDLPMAETTFKEICKNLQMDPTTVARLKAVRTQEASAWLYELPVNYRLLENEAFRTAMCLRLGIDVCVAHECVCGGWADAKGHHALACKKAQGRIPRHSSLNAVVKRALMVAQIPSQLEPAGLVLQDGRRPDGMTTIPLEDGKIVVWDVTCVCSLATSNIARSTEKAGGAADYAEGKKVDKYKDALPNYAFVPLGFETFGSWGAESKKFLRTIAARQFRVTGEKRSMEFLRQQVSMEIQRWNAACVKGTLPEFRTPVF